MAKKRQAPAKPATPQPAAKRSPSKSSTSTSTSKGGAVRDAGPLSAAELAALALSLAHLGAGPQSVTARRGLRHALDHLEFDDDVIATTLATLTTPLPDDIARRARVVANAITARLVIRIQYLDAASRLTVRDLEPVTCLVHRDFWYLVGWCRLRGAIRAFRFDRVIAVEPTDIPSRPHLPDHYLPFQRRTSAA